MCSVVCVSTLQQSRGHGRKYFRGSPGNRSSKGAGSTEFSYALLAISIAVIVSFVGLGGGVRDLVSSRTQQVAGLQATVDPIGDTGSEQNGPGDNDPGDNDPGDNDPGDNDPGDNDPGDNDPGDNDPGDNDPGDNDPGDNDPGDNDPGDNDPGDNDPGDNDPGDNDPGDNDPGDNDPGDNDPGDNDPGDNDPGDNDPGDNDPVIGDIDNGFSELQCESTWDDDRYAKGEGSWLNPANWAGKIESGIAVVEDFVRGLIAGLGDQARDLWNLISDPSVLLDLGKAFISDPLGTLEEILQGVISSVGEDIQKVMECGPQDIGRIIGQNVNPVVALRVVAKIADSAKLVRLIDDLPDNFGCASFTEGTLIGTPDGEIPIENLIAGNIVYSRDDSTMEFSEKPILQLHRRIAPRYFRVETWRGTINATEEHPFWVQGKGWVRVADLEPEDPLVTIDGDEVFLSKTLIEEETQVYNFSVKDTPNYFAGDAQYWVHNAGPNCQLRRRPDLADGYTVRDGNPDIIQGPQTGVYKAAGREPDGTIVYQEAETGKFFRISDDGRPEFTDDTRLRARDRNRIGHAGEVRVTSDLDSKGWERVSKDHPGNIEDYVGQNGIDGVYRRFNDQTQQTEFLVVEAKSTGGKGAPGDLGRNTGSGDQLSQDWIAERIGNPEKGGLQEDVLAEYELASLSNNVRSVKAEVSETRVGHASGQGPTGTIVYKQVTSNGDKSVVGGVIDI